MRGRESAKHRLATVVSCCALLVVTQLFPAYAHAQRIKVRDASLERVVNEYQVNADFEVDLGPSLEGALGRGVPLYFVLEFRLWRPRWWWLDKSVARVDEVRKLFYNALTRQYRISIGSLHHDSNSLYEALEWLGRVRGSPSVTADALRRGDNYIASISLRLAVSQLPKPLQVDAVTSGTWQLASNEFSWDVYVSP